jgi:hypothetical protein
MFKKLLTVVAALAMSVSAANAQCTPNPIYADSSAGIWPDSATNLPAAYTGEASGYSAVIDLKTLTDTTAEFSGFEIDLIVKAFRILDVTGEPAGFVVSPNYNDVQNGTFQNGGVDPNWTAVVGCVLISAPQSAVQAAAGGGPNNDGVYPVSVIVDILAKGADGFPQDYTWVSTLNAAVTYDDYVIRILPGNAPVGVIENVLDANKFNVAPNYPNPFTNITNINYNTVKQQDINFNVYNTVGALVYSNKYQSVQGKNTIVFDGSKLSAGMYIYTVSNGAETITRKMTIN